jgi:hypothetical protein
MSRGLGSHVGSRESTPTRKTSTSRKTCDDSPPNAGHTDDEKHRHDNNACLTNSGKHGGGIARRKLTD